MGTSTRIISPIAIEYRNPTKAGIIKKYLIAVSSKDVQKIVRYSTKYAIYPLMLMCNIDPNLTAIYYAYRYGLLYLREYKKSDPEEAAQVVAKQFVKDKISEYIIQIPIEYFSDNIIWDPIETKLSEKKVDKLLLEISKEAFRMTNKLIISKGIDAL